MFEVKRGVGGGYVCVDVFVSGEDDKSIRKRKIRRMETEKIRIHRVSATLYCDNLAYHLKGKYLICFR